MSDGSPHPANSALFTERADPETGVRSFLLTGTSIERSHGFPQPVTNVTTDGRFAWIYAAGADGSTTLGVVDLRDDTVSRVESVSPDDPTPVVDPTTGVAYAALDGSVFAYDPTGGSNGEVDRDRIGRFDAAGRLASGLTRSADGSRLCALAADDGTYRLVSLHLPTGETDVWHSRSRRDDTVRFSPTDPTVVLLARNAEAGPSMGAGPSDAWLAREGLGARPLNGLLPGDHRRIWWGSDGTGLWYVEAGSGVGYLDLHLGRSRTVLSRRIRRADSSQNGAVLAATATEADRARLAVFDPSAGTSVDVVSRLTAKRAHPQFVAGDTYIAYTSSASGRPTFALTPLSELESIRSHVIGESG